MKLFIFGDPHLSMDERIEKPMDIFGGDWVNHAEKLKAEWLEAITDEDVVVIAGDISWGLRLDEAMADFDWIHALPGRKLIFKGNHDLWWQSTGKLNKLYEDGTMKFIQNGAELLEIDGKKIAVCGTRGWTCPGTEGFTEHDRKIHDRELLRLKMSLDQARTMEPDEIIGVLHFPPTNDKKQTSGFTELMTEYGVKTCYYGHIHGRECFRNGIQGVLNGVEYRLISLDYLKGKPEEVKL